MENKDKTPQLLRIISLLLTADSLLVLFGVIITFANIIPFPEMRSYIYELRTARVLGIPALAYSTLYAFLMIMAAYGIYTMKRWCAYILVFLVVTSIASIIYVNGSLLTLFKGLDIYALILVLFYTKRLG